MKLLFEVNFPAAIYVYRYFCTVYIKREAEKFLNRTVILNEGTEVHRILLKQ